MAILHFTQDCKHICHLEEYERSCEKKRYRWPALDTPEDLLQRMFRMEPGSWDDSPALRCLCEQCGEEFGSRNDLFRHLRTGGPSGQCGTDTWGKYEPPSVTNRPSRRNVALTVSYLGAGGGGGGDGPDEALEQLVARAVQSAFPSQPGEPPMRQTFRSAVAAGRAPKALVNVATLFLPRAAEGVDDEAVTIALNAAFEMQGGNVKVLWCTGLKPAFRPRVFFERFEVVVPYDLLLGPGMTSGDIPGVGRPAKEWATLSGEDRKQHLQELSHIRRRVVAYRELVDRREGGRRAGATLSGRQDPLRFHHLQAQVLVGPMQVHYVALSLALRRRSVSQGSFSAVNFEDLRGILSQTIAWIRGNIGEDDVLQGALVPKVPAECIYLGEPRMDKAEMLLGRSLCGVMCMTPEQASVLGAHTAEFHQRMAAKEDKLREWAAALPVQASPAKM